MKTFTALFPFCGLGAGARGFLDAQVTILGQPAKFRSLGGIDFDSAGCADFEMLTGSPAWCVDVTTITPGDLLARYGATSPDVVFMSPPCKGASGLLSEEKSRTPKYAAMNELALVWTRTMLAAWPTPPKLVLFENVPRIKKRAASMLRELRKLLRAAGYVFHDGFHDCGVVGGLAQHRRRYLMVARHAATVPPLLYQPPPKRVRGCGEVIGPLPLPNSEECGPMHQLPKISWLNWVRLALIPAGGDWRDLDGVLAAGQERREKFKRHAVEAWDAPTGVVGGSGSNAVANVADPRVQCVTRAGAYGVLDFADPSKTVTGSGKVDNAPASVADPRPFGNVDRVTSWSAPAGTITHAPAPSSGAIAVADPRAFALDAQKPGTHNNKYRVEEWADPAHTVTGATRPGSGAPAVNDPRVHVAFDNGYRVLRFDEPSPTVAGKSHPGNGAYAVADLRVEGKFRGIYGVMSWEEAAGTITGQPNPSNGKFCVADPRKPPRDLHMILASDGTWHRPLTTLELAALQGLPVFDNGRWLKLSGASSSSWRERIGNAVPTPTAQAIAERMLVCLVEASLGGFSLSSGGSVWVQRREMMT